MQIVEVKSLGNGAHDNQNSDAITTPPPGWAEIPAGMAVPETFPFVEIEVERNVVTKMTAGVVPEPEPEPTPEPTQLDRIEAQSAYTAMMTGTLMEV
mgnify:FL=1